MVRIQVTISNATYQNAERPSSFPIKESKLCRGGCLRNFWLKRDELSPIKNTARRAMLAEMLIQQLLKPYLGQGVVMDAGKCAEVESRIAIMYCVECREKLCRKCAKAHTRVKMSRDHKLLDMNSEQFEEDLRRSHAIIARCDKHGFKTLVTFCCNGCRIAVSADCFVESHQHHDCSDIDEAVDEFRDQLKTDTSQLENGCQHMNDRSSSLKEQMEDFIKKADETENEIITRADDLKKLIDENKEAVIKELSVKKKNVVEKLRMLNEIIENRSKSMAKLKTDNEELSETGNSGEIVRDIDAIDSRTRELLNPNVISSLERDRSVMEGIHIKFNPSTLMTEATENLVGKTVFQGLQRLSLSTSFLIEIACFSQPFKTSCCCRIIQ